MKATRIRAVQMVRRIRGRRADVRLFDRVLALVPDTAPVPGDELPKQLRRANKALQPTSRVRRKGRTRKSSRAARG